MVIDNVFGINKTRRDEGALPAHLILRDLLVRGFSALIHQVARIWCAMNGHESMLHFEPNKLSLQCSLCGYASEGWEVGRPMTARRQANNPQARPDRRRTLRPLPSGARLAS
jgi:hypothetical protein